MLFFFNANGDIINYIPEQVHQGSNDANTIYVVAPLPSANQVLAHFTLPNGKVLYPAYATNENNLTLLSTLEINNEEYSVWGLKLKKKVTSIAGNVIVQFSFINASQSITTQSTMFFVSEGTSPYEPLDLTHETTLEDILMYISTLTNSIANKTKVTVNGIPQETWNADDKVDKYQSASQYSRLYGISFNGKDPVYPFFDPAVVNNAIAQRTNTGQIRVPLVPVADNDASSKDYIDKKAQALEQAIASVLRNSFIPVDTLPTASAETLGNIYLVPQESPSENNVKNEYITIEIDGVFSWESIGSTAMSFEGGGTTVTVNGEAVETFDADTKVNKMVSANKLYATDVDSNFYVMAWAVPATANSVPRRDGAGCIYTKTPTANGHATTKAYVDQAVANAGGGKSYKHTIKIQRSSSIEFEDIVIFAYSSDGISLNSLSTITDKVGRLNALCKNCIMLKVGDPNRRGTFVLASMVIDDPAMGTFLFYNWVPDDTIGLTEETGFIYSEPTIIEEIDEI